MIILDAQMNNQNFLAKFKHIYLKRR